MESVFLFQNDLRLVDNHAWNKMSKTKTTHPIVIIDESKFPNQRVFEFYLQSVNDLDKQLDGKLSIYFGNELAVLKNFRDTTLFFNKNPCVEKDFYNPLYNLCKKQNIKVVASISSHSLLNFEELARPYKVFGNFYKTFEFDTFNVVHNQSILVTCNLLRKDRKWFEYMANKQEDSGRSAALKILASIGKFDKYGDTRNIIHKPTTRFSAYLNCGCISVREVWLAAKRRKNTALVQQLFWREFYMQLVFWFPDLLKGRAFYPQRDMSWSNDPEAIRRWKEGKTGYPLVDASMRCLKQTGFLHNRCRMVVASFLVKDLNVDWRIGEAYFKTQLVDFFFPSNNGGWQFISGTGASAMMQSRKFNPFLQSKKYDPDAVFIKTYLPELRNVPASEIHHLKMS